MSPNELKLKKLQDLFQLLDGALTKEEFVQAFQKVLEYVQKFEKQTASDVAVIHSTLNAALENHKLNTTLDLSTWKKEALASLQDMSAKVELAIASVKNGDNGTPGKDGISPDPEAIKQAVISAIRVPTIEDVMNTMPLMGERTRDALELLQGEERLDASAIKNLPAVVEKAAKGFIPGPAVHGPLWALPDVDVTGIVVGQSIKWDGIRWIPFTPAGGATTSVYNEVVAGSGTAFTLANTPTTGNERLYANGQRLTPTVDYSITAAAITTVLSWSAAQITADYDY